MACILALYPSAGFSAEKLTQIAEVRSLSSEEAGNSIPVLIRGVMTTPGGISFAIQDEQDGVWINVFEARRLGYWKGDDAVLAAATEGMEVEISGITDSGGYAPTILPETMKVLGPKPLPQARPIVPARFFSGADDCLRIEANGTVQRVVQREKYWELWIDANPGRYRAMVSGELPSPPEDLIDSEVRIRGVATAIFNTRSEIVTPRISSSIPGDLVITKSAPRPEDVPFVALDHLQGFRNEPIGPHRQRVSGTVTFSLQGRFFYIQEKSCAVRVETSSDALLNAGDHVEVMGFTDVSGATAKITEGTVRKIGTVKEPEIVRINPEEIIEINQNAATYGRPANPNDFDGRLICFRAKLLAVQIAHNSEQSSRRLTVQQGSLILSVILHTGNPKTLDRLLPNSIVEITGIARLEKLLDDETPNHLKSVRMEILLRDDSGIILVKAPPWWTPQRLYILLAATAVILAVVFLWALLLRREVSKKMEIISSSLQSEAVSNERNRVARELHDTLEQQLSGVALQLDGAKKAMQSRPEVASRAMDLAGKMLRHTRLEARRSVWDLRSQILETQGLLVALQTMVESVASPSGAKIEVISTGECRTLPDGSDFQLLRVAQEALANALKHAEATNITISLETAPEKTRLRVCDDGKGFDPDAPFSRGDPHFGLLGMRERAVRIGAEFSISSSPGAGCTMTLDLPANIIQEPKPDR